MLVPDLQVGVDIGAGMDTEINADELTAEREREALCVGMDSVPTVAEAETAVTGVETQIHAWGGAVEQFYRQMTMLL